MSAKLQGHDPQQFAARFGLAPGKQLSASARICSQLQPVSAQALPAWTFSGAGSLLDHIGGYVNPLRLIRRIPEGMAIARLRDRIVQIVADFRTQTSLREGCNTILHTDCVLLAQVGPRKLHRSQAANWAVCTCLHALQHLRPQRY